MVPDQLPPGKERKPGYLYAGQYLTAKNHGAEKNWMDPGIQPFTDRPRCYQWSFQKFIFAQCSYQKSIDFVMSHYQWGNGYLYTYVYCPGKDDYHLFVQMRFDGKLPPPRFGNGISKFVVAPVAAKYSYCLETEISDGNIVSIRLIE